MPVGLRVQVGRVEGVGEVAQLAGRPAGGVGVAALDLELGLRREQVGAEPWLGRRLEGASEADARRGGVAEVAAQQGHAGLHLAPELGGASVGGLGLHRVAGEPLQLGDAVERVLERLAAALARAHLVEGRRRLRPLAAEAEHQRAMHRALPAERLEPVLRIAPVAQLAGPHAGALDVPPGEEARDHRAVGGPRDPIADRVRRDGEHDPVQACEALRDAAGPHERPPESHRRQHLEVDVARQPRLLDGALVERHGLVGAPAREGGGGPAEGDDRVRVRARARRGAEVEESRHPRPGPDLLAVLRKREADPEDAGDRGVRVADREVGVVRGVPGPLALGLPAEEPRREAELVEFGRRERRLARRELVVPGDPVDGVGGTSAGHAASIGRADAAHKAPRVGRCRGRCRVRPAARPARCGALLRADFALPAAAAIVEASALHRGGRRARARSPRPTRPCRRRNRPRR